MGHFSIKDLIFLGTPETIVTVLQRIGAKKEDIPQLLRAATQLRDGVKKTKGN